MTKQQSERKLHIFQNQLVYHEAWEVENFTYTDVLLKTNPSNRKSKIRIKQNIPEHNGKLYQQNVIKPSKDMLHLKKDQPSPIKSQYREAELLPIWLKIAPLEAVTYIILYEWDSIIVADTYSMIQRI